MCLNVKEIFRTRREAREFARNPLIAKKDITVYKVICPSGQAPYRSFIYEKGYHYYNEGKRALGTSIVNFRPNQWEIRVNQGLHSFIDKRCAKRMAICGRQIVQMVIPKGSKYFLGEKGHAVSDNLIWY